MIRMPFVALAALVWTAASTAAGAQTWTDWGEAEIRTLAGSENGVVTEVLAEDAGELRVYATFDDWLRMQFIGQDCTASGGKPRCPTLAFNALFEVDDASRAQALERDLTYQYVADMADGEDFVIHRQVELEGGAPLANLRRQLYGFIVVAEKVADDIWPPMPDAASGAASGKGVSPRRSRR